MSFFHANGLLQNMLVVCAAWGSSSKSGKESATCPRCGMFKDVTHIWHYQGAYKEHGFSNEVTYTAGYRKNTDPDV